MIQFGTDTIPPFRPEWVQDNIINGRPRKNPNNVPRERTIGIYEDQITQEVYVVATIRNINYPNHGHIAKTVLKNRLKLLKDAETESDDCIPYGIVFQNRNALYHAIENDDQAIVAALKAPLSLHMIDRLFLKLDKRIDHAKRREEEHTSV